MLVAGDQQVRPPRCPVVDLLDQVLEGVTIPLARHEGQQQSALGIDGGVVPVVTTPPVQRVERIARLLLLTGYPGILNLRKLLSSQEVSQTHQHQDMPRCVSPTPP